jgi:hypothetical protein
MPESNSRSVAQAQPAGHEASAALRRLGSRAHQLRAAARAADHFNAQDNETDRSTGSWLMSCALSLSEDLTSEIDVLARNVREGGGDATIQQHVAAVRVRAHQLHAATRAADHFLDQESREDHETGSWLIACAAGLAEKLAADLDDGVALPRRPPIDKTAIEGHDPQLARRVNAATATPIRASA